MSHSSCARQRARSSIFIVSESLFPIRLIGNAGGTVRTVAGSGFADGFGDIIGPEGTRLLSVAFQRSYLSDGTSSHFNQPWGVAVDGEGNILVADNGNTRIQRIASSGTVSTCFACSGEFRGVVLDTDGMPVATFLSP